MRAELKAAYDAGVQAGKKFDLTNPTFATLAERIEFRRGWWHGLKLRGTE